ncbi:MAG TPA: hypothetical protein VHD36_14245 [Pirellulales bacterium]|nr:hypothetical protein [Pirellulales bacterium]
MCRLLTLVACVVAWSSASLGLAQLQNPTGFLDPAGVNRAGTANPPNTTIGPIGGSTLPPGAPSGYYPREVETNPALRQEVRRPFGGGGFRYRAAPPPDGVIPEGTGDADASGKVRRTERPAAQVDARTDALGPATGKLARDWRYVYSQGRHWYWMPNDTWDVWHNSGWVPYKRGMFSQPYFGYGTQVRGYRAMPPDAQAGGPVGAPGQTAAAAHGESAVARARTVTGSERTYAPEEVTVPPETGDAVRAPAAENSSAGPAMPNEHFISP